MVIRAGHQEPDAVFGVSRSNRYVEVWEVCLWWELRPEYGQVSRVSAGAGLILAPGEGRSTRSTCCHPPGSGFLRGAFPTLTTLSIGQGLLKKSQRHS
jgi:hypothetical protein